MQRDVGWCTQSRWLGHIRSVPQHVLLGLTRLGLGLGLAVANSVSNLTGNLALTLTLTLMLAIPGTLTLTLTLAMALPPPLALIPLLCTNPGNTWHPALWTGLQDYRTTGPD